MTAIQRLTGPLVGSVLGGVLGGYFGFHLAELRAARADHSVRAERFELVGSDGRIRAFWGQNEGGDVVTAYVDSSGKVRAELGVSNDGAVQWLRMIGADGRSRVRLGTDSFSQSGLNLGDEQHESRILLGSIPGDLPIRPESWGLIFPRSGTLSSWIDIGIRVDDKRRGATPFFAIRDNSGARWEAPVGK
jgi:hypothetical protein